MKNHPLPHVVNVYRDKLVMCTSGTIEPLVFKFSPDMVSDLDVVNHQNLNAGLKTFMDSHKLKPASLVIILNSSIYFEKDYLGPNVPASTDMEEFIDTIPFSATSSKLFRSGTGFKQIVINSDLYESLKKSFEVLGYSVSAVVPGFVLGPTEPHQEITAETCRVIYKKMDQITADSFTGLTDASASFQQKEQFFLKKYQTLAVIISLLFVATAVFVVPMTLRRPKLPAKKIPSSSAVRPSVTPIPTPVANIPSTPSAEILAAFTVQILNGSGKTGEAASLSGRLTSVGFTAIQTGNNPQVSDKTLLILSPRIATVAGEFVTNLVKDLYPEVSGSTNTDTKFDVSVIIGKNTP